MGEVFRARDMRLDRLVALKLLPEDLFTDQERTARFEREARLLAALNHPNVATVYAFEEIEGRHVLAMELLDGGTLADVLADGPLPPRRVVALATQMAEGLAAAHEKGVVHRDLKPGNVWISGDEQLKILDFGLAKKMEGFVGGRETTQTAADHPLGLKTKEGTLTGTLGYMSPEQVRGEPVDLRTDIFSFGAVLYEMLAGRRAFSRNTAAETLAAILKEDPPELHALSQAFPAGLQRIVARCLEKSPGRRFQSARDLGFALDSSSTGVLSGPAPSPRSNQVASWLLLSAVGLLLAGGGFLAGRTSARAVPSPPRFTQLTFSDKPVLRARFTHDGRSVVYGLAESGTMGTLLVGATMHELSFGNPIPRRVFERETLLLSVSSRDQLAVATDLTGPRVDLDLAGGTLGISPLAGALPRAISNGVLDAAWHPDGKSLALIRFHAHGCQLEFPEGRILYRLERGGLASLRFSPDGRYLAMFRRPVGIFEDAGAVLLVEAGNGVARVLGSEWDSTAGGLAFRPDGKEIWFGAARNGTGWEIRGVDLNGRERGILTGPSALRLMDVDADGRALVEEAELRTDVLSYEAGGTASKKLTVRKSSMVQEVGRDGRLVLMADMDSGSAPNYDLYLRSADGSLPVPAGRAFHAWISEDSKSILSWRKEGTRNVFVLVPIAGGPERTLRTDRLEDLGFCWSRTGELFALARQGDEQPRLWRVGPDEAPRPVSGFLPADADYWFWIPEPAGRRALVLRREKAAVWASLTDASKPAEESSWTRRGDEWPEGFSEDGAWIYLRSPSRQAAIEIERLNLSTGKREPYRRFVMPGLVGDASRVWVCPDATRLVVERSWFASQLFLVEGMK
jgi:serine/threonine protein kinase